MKKAILLRVAFFLLSGPEVCLIFQRISSVVTYGSSGDDNPAISEREVCDDR